MDWKKGRESDNVVEDEGGGGGGYGGGGMQFGGFHIGIGGIILIVVVSLLFGKNPLDILSMLSGGVDNGAPTAQQLPAQVSGTPSTENDEPHKFVRTILASTEDVRLVVFGRRRAGHLRGQLLRRGRVVDAAEHRGCRADSCRTAGSRSRPE